MSQHVCKQRKSIEILALILASALGADQAVRADVLEEVTVTAQRRAQDVRDVPAAISAFSAAQLAALGITDARGFAGQVPDLQFNSLQGAGGAPSLAMRGIGISTFTDDNENPVAFYIDDVYIGTLGGVMSRAFDMDRVEVLRGPQGTLYGRNTTGGLIHFVTKDPTRESEGYATLGYGTFGRKTFEGAAGGPINDRLRFRLSYSHDERGGIQRSATTGTTHGAERDDSVRAKVAFDINDKMTTLLTGFFSDLRGDSWASDQFGDLDPVTGAQCSVARVFARECVDAFGYSKKWTSPWIIDSEKPREPWRTRLYGVTFKSTLTDGPWSWVNIAAFNAVRKQDTIFGYSGQLPIITVDFDVDANQFSEESRVSYTQDRWLILGGVYAYSDHKNGLISNTNPYTNFFSKNTNSYAAFLHGELQFAPRWTVSVGTRYTKEDVESTSNVDASAFTPFAPFSVSPQASYSNVSWDVGLNWKPTSQQLWFANIKRGFKAGSTDAGGFNITPEAFQPYKPEIVTLYELGSKLGFLDDRARLNTTLFYNDYKDFQALSQINFGNNPISVLSNAGNATTQGVEIEATVEPLTWLELQAHGSFLRTNTKDFKSFSGFNPATGASLFQDLSGTPLATSPRWQYGELTRVHWPLWHGEVSAQADGSFVSSFNALPGGNPYAVVGNYWNLNIRVGWTSADGRYDLALNGNNVTDAYQATSSSDYAGHRFRYVEMRRTFLFSARVNF